MTTQEPTAEKLPASIEHVQPTPWSFGRERLAGGEWYWLTTVRPDGRPHVVPVLAVWHNGAMHFCSHPSARKARNIAQDAHCVLTVAREDAHLVVEGRAVRILDETTLQQVAAVYADKYGWMVTVQNGQFDAEYGAPTSGGPPFNVYQITPDVVFGFGTEESFSPTRWRF